MILCDGNYGLGAYGIDSVHNREPERSRVSYIWAKQDFSVDSNNVYKCECDQFKQLWRSRITCDAIDSNNMMYKTFKYSHGKEK